MRQKIKYWDFNNSWRLRWLRSRNKENKLMFLLKRCNINHLSLRKNKLRLMKKKSRLMLKKMLLKNLLPNVKLPLKRLNLLSEKQKVLLSYLRKITSVK
jgi:hypothetical protein